MKYDDLILLKELLNEGLVTEEEYAIQKSKILGLPIKSSGINSETKDDPTKTLDDDSEEISIDEHSNDTTDSNYEQETVNVEDRVESYKESSIKHMDDSLNKNHGGEKHNIQKIILILFSVVCVFIIGAFVGYQIFKWLRNLVMSDDIVQTMKNYKKMFDDGLIDEDEYKTLKQRALIEQAMDINFQTTIKKKEEEDKLNISTANDTDEHDQLYTILGFGSAAVSLLFIPVLFGLIGVIFGYLLTRVESSNTKGTILIIISIGFSILGMLIGAAMQGNAGQGNNYFIFPWYWGQVR